ncbi:MAG: DUF378 domain-containing protein [Candidatus Blackburnbacteria bacterium]|nr:DUF378 domain-containing protein [Candidatus Blackburnbacteria bacterium]
MKILNLVALVLVLVGALNWGLVSLVNLNLVTALLGEGSTLTALVYDLVGLSAVYVAVTTLPKAAKL